MGILFSNGAKVSESFASSFMTDLNISQIIDAVNDCWGSSVSEFYEQMPLDRATENLRREVYRDIDENGLYDELNDAYQLWVKITGMAEQRSKYTKRFQSMTSLVNEVCAYCRALDTIDGALQKIEPVSEGLKEIKALIRKCITDEKYVTMRDTAKAICRDLNAVRITMTYDNDRIEIGFTDDEEACGGSENGESIPSPFRPAPGLEALELSIVQLFTQKRPQLLKRIKEFYPEYENYSNAEIMQFLKELAYYLSYMCFVRKMSAAGFEFTIPEIDSDKPVRAEGLYDLALAVANLKRDREVVNNDFIYGEGEQFFVLTGPNQGGKTTFARSLGQLVYLSKMGLKCPARSANLHYFTDIKTHFSVEESVETGRGKLMEELVRLKPMVSDNTGDSFVIINELFTTAANYDACIMGRKVLNEFISRKCYGIYVTHLAELLEGTEHAAGLCAQLDGNGVQTFKILRRVMEYDNCAANQVHKYRLSYSELSERLTK